MRLLIHSPSPFSPTGYGQIVKNIAPRLAAMGHDVAIFQYNGHWGPPQKWGDVVLFSRGVSYTGYDMLLQMANKWKADIVISVCDPWIVPADVWRSLPMPVVFWCPVQCEPLHEDYRRVLDEAQAVWVYSEYGTEVLHDAGYPDAIHVPLGYDDKLYGNLDRVAARAWFNDHVKADVAGKFLVGVVAANASTIPASRKGLDTALRVMANLDRAQPDTYAFYMHTRFSAEVGGIDLNTVITALGLDGKVIGPDQTDLHFGFSDEMMAYTYAAFDVLLAPSMAEGFCLPLLEAQMAGTPVVTVDFSSMSEMTGSGIATMPLEKQWADGAPGGWVAVPDAEGMAYWVNSIREYYIDCNHTYYDRLMTYTWDNIAARVAAEMGQFEAVGIS